LEVSVGEGAMTEHLFRAYPDATVTAIDITPNAQQRFPQGSEVLQRVSPWKNDRIELRPRSRPERKYLSARGVSWISCPGTPPGREQRLALEKRHVAWGCQNVGGAYFCCWAAWSVRDKDVDFVECGVNRFSPSRTVMRYVDFDKLDKRFWLLGTFEGSVNRRKRQLRVVLHSAC
jgi:hypothetical protein